MGRIGEKIKRRREAMGLTQAQLGRLIGVSYQTISGWEAGNEPPPSKHLGKLSSALGLSLENLLGIDVPEGAYPVTEMVRIPVIGQAQAGSPRLAIEEHETKPVEKELVQGGEYVWIRVEGDSMSDAGILPGGFLLVRLQPYVENGQIAVVDLFDDGVVVKYVHRTDGRLVLLSANPAYVPIVVDPSRCRIIGLVEEYRRRTI